MPLLNDLLHYLAWRVHQQGGSPAKTRLVKLLYLVDLHTARLRGQAPSGASWFFYHYGPYAFEVDDALEGSQGDTLELERRPTPEGHEVQLFLPRHAPEEGVLSQSIRALCDRWVDQWALADLDELLEFVYFSTPPMREARRDEPLDLLAHPEEEWPPNPRPLPRAEPSDRLRRLYEQRRGAFDRMMPKREFPRRPFLPERPEGEEGRPEDVSVPVHNVTVDVPEEPE